MATNSYLDQPAENYPSSYGTYAVDASKRMRTKDIRTLPRVLLDLTEFPLQNAYIGAPTTVKVALLQFLCDIPAYSKLLHLSGHSALRSCPYCNEVGHYCNSLKKAIHISNSHFLPFGDKMREGTGFALQDRETKNLKTILK